MGELSIFFPVAVSSYKCKTEKKITKKRIFTITQRRENYKKKVAKTIKKKRTHILSTVSVTGMAYKTETIYICYTPLAHTLK